MASRRAINCSDRLSRVLSENRVCNVPTIATPVRRGHDLDEGRTRSPCGVIPCGDLVPHSAALR
jgi:hypothetical protein